MLVKELRIPMPLTVEEYRVAQLYMLDKKARNETVIDPNTGEPTGLEIVENRPFDEDGRQGQYTKKVFHLGSKMPGWLSAILPGNAKKVVEEAWNSYPYTRTIFTCPIVKAFSIEVVSIYRDDDGSEENIFNLSKEELEHRVVDRVDILSDPLDKKAYRTDEDPGLWHSEKSGRGPLKPGWQKTSKPLSCVYKLCSVEFNYWGLQGKVERFAHSTAIRKTVLLAHRQVVCWQDEWAGLAMEDIRTRERETQALLRARVGAGSDNVGPAVAEGLDSDGAGDTATSAAPRKGSLVEVTPDEFCGGGLGTEARDAGMAFTGISEEPEGNGDDAEDEDEDDADEFFDAKEQICGSELCLVVHGNGLLGGANCDEDFATFQESFRARCPPGAQRVLDFRSIACVGVTERVVTALAAIAPHGPGQFTPSGSTFCMLSRSPEFRSAVGRTIARMNEEHARGTAPTKVHIVGDVVGGIVAAQILATRSKELAFSVDCLFCLGCPIGLFVLHDFGTEGGFEPECRQVYNFFQQADPLACRLEPVLMPEFRSLLPAEVPDCLRFPRGRPDEMLDAAATLAEEGHRDVPLNAAFAKAGSLRIDYEALSPPEVSDAPPRALMYLMHASYWNHRDIIAQMARTLLPSVQEPREVFKMTSSRRISSRSFGKAQHRALDVVVRAGEPQVFSAAFQYGRLLVSSPPDRTVASLYVRSAALGWVKLGDATITKGNVSYEVPEGRRFTPGVYPFQFVVSEDDSVAEATMLVAASQTNAVLFSIEGAFTLNTSLTAKRQKLRPGSVEVARFWDEQGYVIFYVTSRPEMQRRKVLKFLARHEFPRGITWFCPSLLTVSSAEARKLEFLQTASGKGASFHFAYGSERSLSTYQELGIDGERIFMLSPSTSDTKEFMPLRHGFEGHLSYLADNYTRVHDPLSRQTSSLRHMTEPGMSVAVSPRKTSVL